MQINEISGKIKKQKESSLIIDANGILYEVMIPPVVMINIEKVKTPNGEITLVTYNYYQLDQSKAISMLVGFLNEIEKDFFEQFITVPGLTPKIACRALALSFSVIAGAIDKGDMFLLATLPGINHKMAKEIIAKLQGKVGKFYLGTERK